MTTLALMTAAASILFSVESLIPIPFPWLRLGLANGVTLLALRWWGLKEALIVAVLRVVIGSLLTGRLLQPNFVLSLGGSLAATLVMGLVMKWGGRRFSLAGISIWGAVSKNAMQLFLVSWLYFSELELLRLLPVLLPASLLSGLLIGLLAMDLDKRLSGAALGKLQ